MARLFGLIFSLLFFENIVLGQPSKKTGQNIPDLDFKLQSVVNNDLSNTRLYFKAPCDIRLTFISFGNRDILDRILYFSNPVLKRVAYQKENLCGHIYHRDYTYIADISLKVGNCLEETDRFQKHINNAYCEVVSYRLNVGVIHKNNPKGLLSGNVIDEEYPDKDKYKYYVKFQRDNRESKIQWYFKEMKDIYQIGVSPCYALFVTKEYNHICYNGDNKIVLYKKE